MQTLPPSSSATSPTSTQPQSNMTLDDDFFHALDSPLEKRQISPSSPSTSWPTTDAFPVYNPVDDHFESWPARLQEKQPTHTNDSVSNMSDDSFHDSYLTRNGSDKRGVDNDSMEKRVVPYNKDDDDAIAQAIAEQGLPPGVSAVEQQELMMRLLTQQLRRGDRGRNEELLSPALEQRLRDFQFAQRKRREIYGNERPWGILGLYDHLAGIRVDVEWAEDAAWRRAHKEPYLSWADFQQTRDSGWNRPFFTYILLAICTVVLITSYGLNGWKVEPLTINPMIGPSAETLIRMGAKQTSLIVNRGEWYRLFSPMVLHAGLIHYFLNMTALWFIGKAVEQCHGFTAAAILFIIPAVGGTILSAIFLPEYISVGASGGIFGLIGACIADISINWSLLFSKHVNSSDEGTRFRHFKVVMWLLFDILINCLVGLTPFVDNFTHLGGMVYGFFCGLSTIERLSTNFFGVTSSFVSQLRIIIIRFSGLILSVVLIMITTALLVESDGRVSPCSSCRYVSCVPFPPFAAEDKKWWYCDDCSSVTADAKLDASGYYSLSLTCPDGVIEEIDLSDQLVTDRQWIRRQLPSFCRKHCKNLFAS